MLRACFVMIAAGLGLFVLIEAYNPFGRQEKENKVSYNSTFIHTSDKCYPIMA
jgi:hypothetical protein